METKILKNKPLMEAIFELRWKLSEPVKGVKIDPHYKLLIGRLYDKMNSEYPFYEQLPSASMPDEISGYVVQHRFRKNKNDWPLIQIGPGVITVNDTEKYIWSDFQNRIKALVDILFEIYPDYRNMLHFNKSLLRYIDAIQFDFQNDDIFGFFRDKMKININLYKKLFDNLKVDKKTSGFDLRFAFPLIELKGTIHLRFVNGKKNGYEALIWETMVEAVELDVPQDRSEIIAWVKKAHDLTDDWFFKIIDGELLRRFE
ncbi:TIGR04255 family protein [bacterium]|nr:TIGR04255 family protein [bacterium]